MTFHCWKQWLHFCKDSAVYMHQQQHVDLFKYELACMASPEVSIILVPQQKTNGIFLLAFGLLQEIRSVANYVKRKCNGQK